VSDGVPASRIAADVSEYSSVFLLASKRERNYFPLTCKFGTYFQLAYDSIFSLGFALKRLENGKVPGDRACSARTADGKPQRGLIMQQLDDNSVVASSERRSLALQRDRGFFEIRL
jgi:hypothetical protein